MQVVAIVFLAKLNAVKSEEHCQHKSTKGRGYGGIANTTVTGKSCIRWSDVTWVFYDSAYVDDHNFCRNPAGSERDQVWCHTTDREQENCRVPFCPPLKVLDFSLDNDDFGLCSVSDGVR